MSDEIPDSTRQARDLRSSTESLLPDDWQALAPLVDAVLDAPPERRAEVLDEVSGGDAVRRAAVKQLVDACDTGAPMFDRPAAERFATLLVDDGEMSLPETLGGRYRIEREVGRGGMARVYLARDTKHARNVAVKVIRPDVAASLGRDRFLREIGIAARLRHPNIVPLYDSGDADGVLYFVMPYEEGPSLRERLAAGQGLPVGECVNALRDVARALVYAHEQGVVHRDVKPDNVMMSGGAAVVTDFGIAKAIAAAAGGDHPAREGTSEAPTAITQLGSALGTPAYMAPEQATGDPSTDHRADIYSFGCLAYELFAGHPPFHGLPAHQIIAAHMAAKPVPLSDVRADVPDAVGRLVARCLQKDPHERPQSAQDLLAELEGSPTGPNAVARSRPFPRVSLALTLAVLVLGVAGYFIARGRPAAITPATGELTLAVLAPYARASDSTLTDMADAMGDEVATALVNVPGVRIMSRSTVGKYRGQRSVVPQTVGKELGARLLVMGGLRGNARQFTATMRLVDANDGSDLWSHTYDRSDGDFSAVREDIVRGIEQTLQARFVGAVGSRTVAARPIHTESPEVHRLYMAGVTKLRQRGQSIRASVDFFRQATQADSLFAKAYSGLSVALALTPYFQETPSREVAAEAIATARRALTLDSTLAQPHVALAVVYEHAYDWDRAGAEFDAAIRLRSEDDAEPLVQYGRYLLFRGRVDDALRQFLAARNTEPASALVSSWVSYAYYLRGQLDSALAESKFAFESDPTNITTVTLGSLVHLKAGDMATAKDFAERSPRYSAVAMYVLAAIGDTAAALTRLREFERGGRGRWMGGTDRAYASLGAGDTTAAMAALERATDANENWPSVQSTLDPMFDPIRGSARYQAILRRVGLAGISATSARPAAPR